MAASWFTVGVFLKVHYGKLEVIRKDHRDSMDCLREMLATWLQSGEASAAELVDALKLAGMSVLAKKIAVKHGEKAYVFVCLQCKMSWCEKNFLKPYQ